MGIEPTTYRVEIYRSTSELPSHFEWLCWTGRALTYDGEYKNPTD